MILLFLGSNNNFMIPDIGLVKQFNDPRYRISINDFDVKRIIGRGNFADVKLAKETSFNSDLTGK